MARKLLSIFFHNVLDERDPAEPYHAKQVTRCELPVLLDFLRSRYTPIDVETFLDVYFGRRRHRFRRPPVLVGFDDGHLGTFANGGPILADLKVPAVVFVLGSLFADAARVPLYVEWFYLLRNARRRRGELRGLSFCLDTPEGYAALRRRMEQSAVREADAAAREQFVDELAEALDVCRPGLADLPADLAYVTAGQLADYGGQEYLAVGSHAMSHLPLSVLGGLEQRRELAASHEILAGLAPTYSRTVSYPFGDHDAATRASAGDIYRFGFAVQAGARWDEPFAYPRTCIAVYSLERFRYTLSRRRRWVVVPARALLSKVGLGGLSGLGKPVFREKPPRFWPARGRIVGCTRTGHRPRGAWQGACRIDLPGVPETLLSTPHTESPASHLYEGTVSTLCHARERGVVA